MDRSSSWTNAGRNADYIPPSRVARMAVPSSRPPSGSTAEAVATARRAEYGTGERILPVLPTAPSASKRSSWTTPRSSSDPMDDQFHQSTNEALSSPPRRAEMASMAATRRAEPVRQRPVTDGLYASDTEQAQLAYMEQMYGTINLLNAELENERRSRVALGTATRPSTYPAMSDYSSLEEDVQIPVSEFDEPSTGFIVSQSPVAPANSPRKLRTMPSPPLQPPHRVARPPMSPRAIVTDQDKELCATLGKNAELRIRSRDMERTVEKTELELELARKQVKMAERRAENREEKLRELLKEKLNWQKELKATRAQVVEEKMRQVDLFREVEAAKRQFVVELETVDQELRAAQEENTQLRTHAAEMKAQMNFQARKMEEMARQAQDEKARFVAVIEDTRHRFREWKEGEAEVLSAAHDQAMRNLKTEYELKLERHQDEKQKLRDKVNDLEVSVRLLQKDRTLSPLELSLRKTAILGSKDNTSTVEAEHIETQSRILELENLLAHSQAYQARQESIIKLSEATISRLMQAREVTALENLSLHPFGVEPRSEDLLYDTQLTGFVTTPSRPARPMSPPKTPSRRPQSGVKSNEPPIVSSPKSKADTPRREDQAENSRPSSREKTLLDELEQLRKELAEAQAKAAEHAVTADAYNAEVQQSVDLNSNDIPDSQGVANHLPDVQHESGVIETTKDIANEAPLQLYAKNAEVPPEAELEQHTEDHSSDAVTNDTNDKMSCELFEEPPFPNSDEEWPSDTIAPAASSVDFITKESDKTLQNESGPSEILSAKIEIRNDSATEVPIVESCDASEPRTPIDEKVSTQELSELVNDSITNDAKFDEYNFQPEDITAAVTESFEDSSPIEEPCTSRHLSAEPVTSTEETTDHGLDTEASSDYLEHENASEYADKTKTREASDLPSLDTTEGDTSINSNIAMEEEAIVGEPDIGAVLEDASQILDLRIDDGEDELAVVNADEELPSSEAAAEIANNVEGRDMATTAYEQSRDVYSSELETEPMRHDQSIVSESDGRPEVAANDLPGEEPNPLESEGKTSVEMEITDHADNKVDAENPGILDVADSSVENAKLDDAPSIETQEIRILPVKKPSEITETMEPIGSQTEVSRLLQEENVASSSIPPEMLKMSPLDSADSVAEALIEIVECVSSHQDSREDVSDGVPDNADITELADPASTLDLLPSETPEACVAKVLVDLAECTALSRVISIQKSSDASEREEELPNVADVIEDAVIQVIGILDAEDNTDEVPSAKEELSPPVLNAEVEDGTTPSIDTLAKPDTHSPVDGEPDDCGVLASSETDAGATESIVEAKKDVQVAAAVAKACATNFVNDLMEILDHAPSIRGNQEIGEVADANTSANTVEDVAVDISVPTSTNGIDDSATNAMEDSHPIVSVPLVNDEVVESLNYATAVPDNTPQTEDVSASTEIIGQEPRVREQEVGSSPEQSGDAGAMPLEQITTDGCIQDVVNDVGDILTIVIDLVDSVEAEALSSVVRPQQNDSFDDTNVVDEHGCDELGPESINEMTSIEQNESDARTSESEVLSGLKAEVEEPHVVEANSIEESDRTNDESEISQIIQDCVEAVENAAIDSTSEHSNAVETPVALDIERPKASICDEFATQEIVSGVASLFASQAIAVALSRLSNSCERVADVEAIEENNRIEDPCTAELEIEVTPDTDQDESEPTPDDSSAPILEPAVSEVQQQQPQPTADNDPNNLALDDGSTQLNDDAIVSDVAALPSSSAPNEALVVEEFLFTTTSIVASTMQGLVDAVENCCQVEKENLNESKTPDQEVEASESLDTKMEDTDKHDEIELYAATRFGSSLEDGKHVICLTMESLVDAVVAANDANSRPHPVDESIVERRYTPKHARSVRFDITTIEEQPDRLNVPRRSVLLWQAPNDKACAKEAVESSAKRRASRRRISRRTLPDLLAFPTEMARFTSSDTTLLAYDARHEQGHICSLLDQSILTIDPNRRHIDLDDPDERVQSKIIGKRKTLTQEIHSKNLALRQIPRFNYTPMRIKFQWSDFVVATPVRPSSSNLGEVKPPVEPMRLLLKKGAKLPCGSYVIVSAFIRPLEDGNENLRVQIYDAERVEEFQFDFSEDLMKKYHLESTGMEAQSLEFLGHLQFRRDEDTVIIKLPEKKAGEGSKSGIDRIQSELTMVGAGDPRKRDPPV
ncbi:hypothetical protein F443_05705 [Phytophthora nicotianae P1569]|uniref:Uncharacterized protein n=1 Tax=Phytophthora nicotianae P1569 TaxID=1317065 RepID=V9FH73_PHYNI|nr:hypothetical protein F443_05705 [Phytophthora nicotianae P1569]